MSLGSFFDGSRMTFYSQGFTGKKTVEKSFAWNTSKVEPLSVFYEPNIVERQYPITWTSPITAGSVVHADLNPSTGALRTLFRLTQSTGPDLLGYMPDNPGLIAPVTTPLTVNGNQTCTLYNSQAQMDPFVTVCYNSSIRTDNYSESFSTMTTVTTCVDTWNGGASVVCGGLLNTTTITNTTLCTGGNVCYDINTCTSDPTYSVSSCTTTPIQNCTDSAATCAPYNYWINSTNVGTMSVQYCSGGGGCKNFQRFQVCFVGGTCQNVTNCTVPTTTCTPTANILNYTDYHIDSVEICTSGGGTANPNIICTAPGVCSTVNSYKSNCNNVDNYTSVRRLRLLGEEQHQDSFMFDGRNFAEEDTIGSNHIQQPSSPSEHEHESRRRILAPRITMTTTTVPVPGTRTIYYNVTYWKLNVILASLKTPDYTLIPQTNDVMVDLNNFSNPNNYMAALAPQESDNLALFYTNNNVATMFFIWEKPKLNMVITDEYNNTDIYCMIVYPNGTLNGTRLNYTQNGTINATTNLKLITDVRAVYENTDIMTGLGTTGTVHLIITGLLNSPNDNVTKMFDCIADLTLQMYRSCQYMSGYQLDQLYPISNLLYVGKNIYELYFTSRGDPTLVNISLYNKVGAPNRNNSALVPHSLYPMHKISSYFAGQTVNWGDPNPFNYTFGWNRYSTVSSFYAVSSSFTFNNYRSGLLFTDSGLYKFLKKSQLDLNYWYNSSSPNGPETVSLNYSHANGTVQISNATFEIVNLTTLTDFSAIGFPVQNTKCYKTRLCRMRLPIQPSVPRYGPHYSFAGYTGDSTNPRLMVLREAIAIYYNNDGMVTPSPPSIQYFFPDFAVFKASDSSTTYETTKCNIERTAYTNQYICSAIGMPTLPYSKDFMTGDKVVIFYNTYSIYFETYRPAVTSPTAVSGSYLITSRFPMNYQYYFNLTASETGPFSGNLIFTSGIPMGSFFTWNPVAMTSRLCVVTTQTPVQLAYTTFGVQGCKTLTTQPSKLVLSTSATGTFLSHISNVTKRGFQFVRESVTLVPGSPATYNVGVDSSLTLDFNELNFNSSVLTKSFFCSIGNNFVFISPSWKVLLGKWNATDSVGGKAAFLAENVPMAVNMTDVYASKCISELQSMVLLTTNGTQVFLTILNLTDVANPRYFLAVQQKLEETYTLGVNMDNAISYGDNRIYVRVNSRTFVFRYDHFDLNFQLVDGVVGSTGISYRAEVSPYTVSRVQGFPINFTSVAENNTIDILNQWTFNLTSKNPIDQMLIINGHVWDISLSKPPYVSNMNLNMNSRIMRMPILPYKLDTSTLAAFSSSMVYHSKFSFLGNTTAVIKNFQANQTYLEVKPNKNMAIDPIAWIAYLPYNCHEIALVSAAYPSFTALLKCTNETESFLYGIQGTMTLNLNAGNYFHFRCSYNGPANDPSTLQASTGNGNPTSDIVAVLHNAQNGTAWKYAFRVPTILSVNGTASSPTPVSRLAAWQLHTGATLCSYTVSQLPNHVTVCANLNTSNLYIYTMGSGYFAPVMNTIGMPPSVLPVALTCMGNYTKLTPNMATLRCILGTNTEMYMVDMDEMSSYKFVNYSQGGALATNASNPRVYSICMDYVPQSIAMTQHFIGVLSRQTTTDLTTGYPSWGFHLFHIDSQNTLNFTNQTNISNQYAGLLIPKGSGSNPFHLSTIFPYQENTTALNFTYDNITNTTLNYSVPVQDNYFHLQDGTGNIYTYKADSYMLVANLNNTKLKSYMDSSMFTVDPVAYPSSQVSSPVVTSSIFERRVVVVAANTNTVAATNTGNKTMNTVWVVAGIAAATALAAALYLMLRKTDSKTKSLAMELRHESGILRL